MNYEFVDYVNHPRNYTIINSPSCGYYVHSDQKDPKNRKAVISLKHSKKQKIKTTRRQQTSVSTLILSIALRC
jgi:hypothetical protein